jgi:hypothetical protein
MSYHCSEDYVNRWPCETVNGALPDVWRAHRPVEVAACECYLRFELSYDEREQDLRAA